jgi:hypothetical protein
LPVHEYGEKIPPEPGNAGRLPGVRDFPVAARIVWLLSLQKLYTIGWFSALVIAVFIWIVTSVVGWFLPVL